MIRKRVEVNMQKQEFREKVQTLHTKIPVEDGEDAVLSVKRVSKKFCRNLKRSMAYGIMDLSKNLIGSKPDSSTLRKDEFWALDDINFELKKGECLGLIGPNGSGKSTLLRLLCGIFPPDKGEIMLKGRVAGLVALGAGFHPHMTGRENIYLNGTILGLSRQEIQRNFDQIIEFADIGDFLEAPVSTYSSGMRVRLGFAVVSQIRPDILLIDEVLAVGDVGFRTKCLNAIHEIMNNAVVIFVSHSMPYILSIATQIMVLEKGKVAFYGHDVAAGIDTYLSKFNTGEVMIAGSGKATITEVTIPGPVRSGSKIPILKHGDDFEAFIQLRIDDDVEQVLIRVEIRKEEFSQAIIDITDHDYKEFVLRNTRQAITLKLTLPNIQFNTGIHHLYIVVSDAASREILLKIDNIGKFQVSPIYASWAGEVREGQWEIIK